MATFGNPSDRTGRSRTIVRAVVPRVFFYGGIALLAWYLAGFPMSRSSVTAVPPRDDKSAPSEPGWPHLRGPKYNAEAPNALLADSWPADGPPVLWTREVGHGYSGVIAVGNCVYTQAQSFTEQKVLALDADTGQTIWGQRYAWPFEAAGMYPGPRSTPTWSNGCIYFSAPDGLVGCLSAADGQPLWKVELVHQFAGQGADFGYACSPLVEDGKVILPVGGRSAAVVALDAESGKTVWASGSAAASYCSAIPINFRGSRQVVAFLRNEMDGFDLNSGKLLWRQSYSAGGYDEHAAFPLYEEPYLRTMEPFQGGSHLYQLEAVPPSSSPDRSDVRLKLLRHDRQMSNDVASSVLVGGCVYGFDVKAAQTSPHRPTRGMFRCIDFKSGATRWSSDRPGQATIVVADKKLLLFNDRGEVILLRANPQRYEELSRAEIFSGEMCWTAPSLHRGRLYLRSPTRVACLYVGPPGGLDRRQQELARPASAIPKGRWLELGWLVGAEREHPLELPDRLELARWYLFSLAVLAAAGLLAAGVHGLLVLVNCHYSAGFYARIVFWSGLFLLGIVATLLGNRVFSRFVFTWPLSLLAVHQLVLAVLLWSRQPQRANVAAWSGEVAAGLLVLVCVAYYELTRRLSLAPAWYFLPTFLAAWPLALPAARRLASRRSIWSDIVWFFLVFSLYFSISGGLMLWRTAVMR
jgi:hypothetical protein